MTIIPVCVIILLLSGLNLIPAGPATWQAPTIAQDVYELAEATVLGSVPAENGCSPLASRYPVAYNRVMVEIRQTEVYARWFRRLRDREARVRIDSRIRRLSLGNPADVRPVGEGVSEIRIDYGPGYRVYFVQRGEALVVLLAGGDKDSQDRDIRRALELARGL